MQSFLPMRD